MRMRERERERMEERERERERRVRCFLTRTFQGGLAHLRHAEPALLHDYVGVVLGEPLDTAGGPLLNSDVVVHDAVGIGAAHSVGIPEEGLGRGVGFDEVMVHAQVVAQLVCHDLRIKGKSFQAF